MLFAVSIFPLTTGGSLKVAFENKSRQDLEHAACVTGWTRIRESDAIKGRSN